MLGLLFNDSHRKFFHLNECMRSHSYIFLILHQNSLLQTNYVVLIGLTLITNILNRYRMLVIAISIRMYHLVMIH